MMRKKIILVLFLAFTTVPMTLLAAVRYESDCISGIGFLHQDDDTADSDGIPSYVEDANKNCRVDAGELDFTNHDTDGDGLWDGYEMGIGDGDVDGDGTPNALDPDSDDDNIPDADEDKNHSKTLDQIGESNPYNEDTDADGINDDQEHPQCRNNSTIPCYYRCNPLIDMENDAYLSQVDSDQDGFFDWQEDRNGNCRYNETISGVLETDPFNADTDGDGIQDKGDQCPVDANNACKGVCAPGQRLQITDPGLDTDQDGLKNWEEDWDDDCIVDAGETDPLKADTDGDTLEDRFDCVNQGQQPDIIVDQFEAKTPTTQEEMDLAKAECQAGNIIPKLRDCDRDKIPDYLEDLDNDCDASDTETDRFKSDTDGDDLVDGIEIGTDGVKSATETDALLWDTDGDGIADGDEDQSQNGRTDPYESDPRKTDTDFDGIPDNIEDQNLDGICDVILDANHVATGDITGGSELSCAWSADTDHDGLPDGAEDCHGGSGTLDEGEPDPRVKDTDGDGIIDSGEDRNANCELDENETSPTSATTYGQNDLSFNRRKRGVDVGCGCTVGGAATPGLQALGMALLGFGLMIARRRKTK